MGALYLHRKPCTSFWQGTVKVSQKSLLCVFFVLLIYFMVEFTVVRAILLLQVSLLCTLQCAISVNNTLSATTLIVLEKRGEMSSRYPRNLRPLAQEHSVWSSQICSSLGNVLSKLVLISPNSKLLFSVIFHSLNEKKRKILSSFAFR